jgi:CheY-like chemotaxis protein
VQTAFNVGCCVQSAGDQGIGFRTEAQEAPGDTPDTELRKVLVVDDERDLADLAGLLLCSCGLGVTVAYSAIEALQVLESDQEINAIFSDVMMPGMTGLQLARVVGDLYPHVKIVLTSGYTSSALLTEHGRDRPYLFTAKPYRIETVIELLRDDGKPTI